MPRRVVVPQWWCSTAPAILLVICLCGIPMVTSDCWYDSERHEEGNEVPTAEPCLNCTCTKGTLLCYLRVCPKLPNPPPPGCILLHRYRTCCPELICSTDFFGGGGNGLEARAEPDGLDVIYDRTILESACLANGSIYGPGSAMDSSSLCEYCYCLGGKQTCVKPKCLVPIEGCVPMYEPTNCCPVHYNCTHDLPSTSTTTSKPLGDNGCIVDGVFYREGGKVLGVGHSACDNCYCLRGMLRCEPLSCASPLLGCAPVVRAGECCAASYNCSGTIEIHPQPNYGHYPTVSKEYAKLRKEVVKTQTRRKTPDLATTESVNNVPFYVVAQRSPSGSEYSQYRFQTAGTTRHHVPGPLISTSTEKETRSEYDLSLPGDALLTIMDSLLDNRLTRMDLNSAATSAAATTTEDLPTSTDDISTIVPGADEEITTSPGSTISESTELTMSTLYDDTTTTTGQQDQELREEEEEEEEEEEAEEKLTTTTTNPPLVVTLKTVLNSTDCGLFTDTEKIVPVESTTTMNRVNDLLPEDYVSTTNEDYNSTTITDGTTSYTGDYADDVEGRVKAAITLRSVPKIPEEIETILNATSGLSKSEQQDYEYDYNEPTLPPSLPNLRIIPFVAADALDSKKDKHSAIYTPQKKDTDDNILLYGEDESSQNLFSPPAETEGGFIPKEPPTLGDSFYENTSSRNPPTIINTTTINCATHGESIPSTSPCVACTCFFGNVVCQKITCPPPPLVIDIIPEDKAQSENSNSTFFDSVFQLFFANKDSDSGTTTTTEPPRPSSTNIHKSHYRDESLGHPNSVDSALPSHSSSLAILKLAGCNIYGRMYRVGRIISELSNPCLECKCTEIGVQCRALKC